MKKKLILTIYILSAFNNIDFIASFMEHFIQTDILYFLKDLKM